MNARVVEVQVRAIIPTGGGWVVFLGNESKVFVIFVDQSVGTAIAMFVQGMQQERPLTHDLISNILRALGTKIERVIVNDLKKGTFFARLILNAENELQQEKDHRDRRSAQRLHRDGGSTTRPDLCKP